MSTLTVINKVAIVKTGKDITIIAMPIFTYAVYVFWKQQARATIEQH